jgi:hypothetical protein
VCEIKEKTNHKSNITSNKNQGQIKLSESKVNNKIEINLFKFKFYCLPCPGDVAAQYQIFSSYCKLFW